MPTQPGEQVTQNNARDALIQVNDRAEKVLYYEGEPRFETSSSAARVEDDKNLQVVSLAPHRREQVLPAVDVDDPDELVGGFPKTREELFDYRGADSRQRRGGLVHARAAAHDRRLRRTSAAAAC